MATQRSRSCASFAPPARAAGAAGGGSAAARAGAAAVIAFSVRPGGGPGPCSSRTSTARSRCCALRRCGGATFWRSAMLRVIARATSGRVAQRAARGGGERAHRELRGDRLAAARRGAQRRDGAALDRRDGAQQVAAGGAALAAQRAGQRAVGGREHRHHPAQRAPAAHDRDRDRQRGADRGLGFRFVRGLGGLRGEHFGEHRLVRATRSPSRPAPAVENNSASMALASASPSWTSVLTSLPASGPAIAPTPGIIPTSALAANGASRLAIGAAIFATLPRMLLKRLKKNSPSSSGLE